MIDVNVCLKQSLVDLAIRLENQLDSDFPGYPSLGFPKSMRKIIIQTGTNKVLTVKAKWPTGCYTVWFNNLNRYSIPREYLTVATISTKE